MLLPRRAHLLLLLGLGGAPALAQEYPLGPLRSPPSGDRPPAGAILQWLKQESAPPPEALGRAREDLYGLVADRLRARVAAGEPAWRGAPDTLLAATFQVAGRAGAIGAGRIAHTLLPAVIADAPLVAPAGATFTFEAPVFRLADPGQGWSVSFPFYYMISEVARRQFVDGREYLVAMLSTLDAPHTPAGTGRSQSTLLLVASPEVSAEDLAAFWGGQLGMPGDAQPLPPGLGVPRAHYFAADDPSLNLRKAFVVLATTRGAVGVAFIGREGTFEVNEADFHEFVRRLSASRGEAAR